MRVIWEPGTLCRIGVGLGVVGVALSAMYVLLGFAYYFEFVMFPGFPYHFEFAVFPVWGLVFGVLVPVMGYVSADMKYKGVGSVLRVGSGGMVLILLMRMARLVVYAFVPLLYGWLIGAVIWITGLMLLFIVLSGVGGVLCILSGILLIEVRNKSP